MISSKGSLGLLSQGYAISLFVETRRILRVLRPTSESLLAYPSLRAGSPLRSATNVGRSTTKACTHLFSSSALLSMFSEDAAAPQLPIVLRPYSLQVAPALRQGLPLVHAPLTLFREWVSLSVPKPTGFP